MSEQFGFRAYQHQILRVVEFHVENLNMNIPAAAIYLGVTKGFDKIRHKGIDWKLIELGIHAGLIHLIHSYLSDRNF